MRTLSVVLGFLITLAGCASGGGGGGTPERLGDEQTNTAQESRQSTNQRSDGPLAPISRSSGAPEESSAQAASDIASDENDGAWRPSWYFSEPARAPSGGVQACGRATDAGLLEARRAAIVSAREKAMQLAETGGNERVIQAATNPNAEGGYTVWVKLEVGGR